MSQYLEFFIKGKDNQFYPIADYCGGSSYFEAFEYEVPHYDGLGAITPQVLGSVRGNVARHIKEQKRVIEREKIHKQDILQANNSFEEKADAIYDCDQCIEDIEDEIEAYDAVDHFIDFLYQILDSIEYRNDFEGLKDKYLYAGIEPTFMKDAKEISDEERKGMTTLL